MESRPLCWDIIYEILARSSLKTLDKCKLVCKQWDLLTYDSSFMHLHSQKTNTLAGYFVQNMVHNNHVSKYVSIDNKGADQRSILSLDFLPRDVKIEASSNQGILCCVSRRNRDYRYYVCKPSIRQFQSLPNPKMRYMTEKVGLVVLGSNPLRYKIIRLSWPLNWSKDFHNYRCEIFDSKIWAWKESEDILLPYDVTLDIGPSILINGAIHWLTSNNHVLAFNEDLETYKIFPLPKQICENGDNYKDKLLVKYEGHLGFICKAAEGCLELWVMEEYGNYVWKKRYELRIEALKHKEPYPSPADFYSADIALIKGFNRVIFYKFHDFSFNVVKLDHLLHPNEVFPLRSDSEPTNLRGGV